MKATNFVSFVCLSSVCYYATFAQTTPAVELKAGKLLSDEPLQVFTTPGVRGEGIKGCIARVPAATFNIRINSLKTSKGHVYTRRLVNPADLACYEKTDTNNFSAATHIGACAEATANAGLNSFKWEGGACTGFLAWQPRARANCGAGGSNVIYVVDEPLTPFAGGELGISGKLRFDLPQVYLDISSYYVCSFGAVSKGYKLLSNGIEEILPEGMTTYSLDRKHMCSDSQFLSVWSVGADGEVNSNEVKMVLDSESTRWYGLETGGCVFADFLSSRYTFNEANARCASWRLSLFYEEVDGEAAAFLYALDAIQQFPSKDNFYVGLTNFQGTNWQWLGGLVQPLDDPDVWFDNYGHPENRCASACNRGKYGIVYRASCNDYLLLVCYVAHP